MLTARDLNGPTWATGLPIVRHRRTWSDAEDVELKIAPGTLTVMARTSTGDWIDFEDESRSGIAFADLPSFRIDRIDRAVPMESLGGIERICWVDLRRMDLYHQAPGTYRIQVFDVRHGWASTVVTIGAEPVPPVVLEFPPAEEVSRVTVALDCSEGLDREAALDWAVLDFIDPETRLPFIRRFSFRDAPTVTVPVPAGDFLVRARMGPPIYNSMGSHLPPDVAGSWARVEVDRGATAHIDLSLFAAARLELTSTLPFDELKQCNLVLDRMDGGPGISEWSRGHGSPISTASRPNLSPKRHPYRLPIAPGQYRVRVEEGFEVAPEVVELVAHEVALVHVSKLDDGPESD